MGQLSPLSSVERYVFPVRPEAHGPEAAGPATLVSDTPELLSADLEEKEPQLLCWVGQNLPTGKAVQPCPRTPHMPNLVNSYPPYWRD